MKNSGGEQPEIQTESLFHFCFLSSVFLKREGRAPCRPPQQQQQPQARRARPPSQPLLLPLSLRRRLPPRRRPQSPSLPRRQHRWRRLPPPRRQHCRRPRQRARPRSKKLSTDSKRPGPCLPARARSRRRWSCGASAHRSRRWTRAWGSSRRASAFFEFLSFFVSSAREEGERSHRR